MDAPSQNTLIADYAIFNDAVRWADPVECSDLLFAGVWYLYETLQARYPKSPLIRRALELGDRWDAVRQAAGDEPSRAPNSELSAIFSETNLLGTLGYSLWHLRRCLDSAGMRFELKELAQIGTGQNPAGDLLRLRGQGFLFLAGAELAKLGFEVEFVPRRKGVRTHDLIVSRDGVPVGCEVTSRSPAAGDFDSVEFFWATINELVKKKKAQVAGSALKYGALIIDCSTVWDALTLAEIPCGLNLVYYIPPELGGPRSGSAPLVRYDDSAFSQGLRELEAAIQGTNVQTLILWKHHCEIFEEGYRRHMAYRVLGTIEGATFWSHFPKPLAFPGPGVRVVE
jgi:hypothetical protein